MRDRPAPVLRRHRPHANYGATLAILMALDLLSIAPTAMAQPIAEAEAPSGACSVSMSAEAATAWSELGGAEGRLGCPTAAETATIPSIHGGAARIVAFGERGAIVLPLAGPAAGKAVTMFGCAFVLWTQLGGPGGRLGLPLADAVNNPDGWVQRFEGGQVVTTRAYDTCDIQD